MHWTLRQLHVFAAVARHSSYTRAAEELHLSQPAVSMQMRQLEDAVGLPILEQVGKKIYLTEAGRELLRYSRRVDQELREAEEVIASLKGLRRGHLRISVATTANYFATRLLAAFVKKFQGVSFTLDVTNRKTLLDKLVANEPDVVIMGQPPETLELEAIPFMENPLVVVARPDHPLACQEGPVTLEQLCAQTFVVREQESGTRIAMERFFADRGISLNAGMEMTSNEAIKQTVVAGLGLGLVSVHTIELELEARRLVVLNVDGFPILRHWYMVHGRGKRLSPVVAAFREFLLGPDARELIRETGAGCGCPSPDRQADTATGALT